jgi:hypothetical protein
MLLGFIHKAPCRGLHVTWTIRKVFRYSAILNGSMQHEKSMESRSQESWLSRTIYSVQKRIQSSSENSRDNEEILDPEPQKDATRGLQRFTIKSPSRTSVTQGLFT